MLEGAPWLLAHKSMLSCDRPMKASLYGRDYVLWRDKHDRVAALPNCCPHMGAMLSEGWCTSGADGRAKVVCPFHALEFDAKGSTILPGSQKKTRSLLDPLELIVRGDFIWTYGGHEPRRSIPNILEDCTSEYAFIGATADMSVATPLLPMLLNMHDYNHQNGTHRDLFQIKEVHFHEFIDNGHHSEAFYDMPTAPATLGEVWRNPSVLTLPKVLQAHLENFFPSLVIFHGESALGRVKQCHVFIPEAENRTQTYVLLFAQSNNPLFKILKGAFLNLSKTVVEQDALILERIYEDSPKQVKLNNEVGMDWVRRNFASWPEVASPDLSRERSTISVR
ncbi:MAG: Rieske 2Fe-2S domain-containing protein [Cyanobacteria bacterium J06642_2]